MSEVLFREYGERLAAVQLAISEVRTEASGAFAAFGEEVQQKLREAKEEAAAMKATIEKTFDEKNEQLRQTQLVVSENMQKMMHEVERLRKDVQETKTMREIEGRTNKEITASLLPAKHNLPQENSKETQQNGRIG